MLKQYNKLEELDEETLLNDPEFIDDAALFLRERESLDPTASAKEVYDAFMEHMRYQDVNEITAIRDLEYAQNADLEGKQRFGRLIDAYDKVNEDVSGRMMWDYAAGVLTAPSTYAGVLTGGTGKLASMAGTQAAKLGVRKILSEGLKSAGKAAAVEGAIGAGQGAVQEFVRVETGIQDEYEGDRTAMMGLAGAATAGLINFPIGVYTAKKASKANEILAKAEIAAAERANKATKKTDSVLKTTSKTKVKEMKETLNALDPTKVSIGRQLKKDMQPGETMEAALGSDVFRNIAAAGIKVKDQLKLKKGERITSAMQRLIADGKIQDVAEVSKILDEHNLNFDQFSLVYLAEVSEAGRTLGAQAQISKALGKADKNIVTSTIDDIDKLNKSGYSALTREDAEQLSKGKKIALQLLSDADKLRLGAMTSQLATTMRNNLTGGVRIAVDASNRTFDNIVKGRNPFDGSIDMFSYMINPYEAQAIRKLVSEKFPNQAALLFRDAADLQAKLPGETILAGVGRKLNYFNTASDNMFKTGMLMTSLKRRLSDKGLDLYKIIETGDFAKIDQDIIKDAMRDSFEFTFQDAPMGDDVFSSIARGVIDTHQKIPFAVSAFLPFPRYVASQLKFMYQHMPLIGMLPLDRLGSKLPARTTSEYLKDKAPKQITGTIMLGLAFGWRVKQGDDAEWYEIKDNKGDFIDARPVYGPFSMHMLFADYLYRSMRGLPKKEPSDHFRDGLTAAFGSTFRAGTGLYLLDKLFDDAMAMEGQKIVAETVGNILNTYTLPLAVVKDFYGQFDPQARAIPETRPGGTDNFFDLIYRRMTRSLPDFPLRKWGVDVETDYDLAALSPYKTGDLKAVNPIEKQIFGFGKRTKNVVEKEMTRLGLPSYKIYKREKSETLDLYTRQELSRSGSPLNMEDRMQQFIFSPEYASLPGNQAKREELKDYAQGIISEAKEMARARIEYDAAYEGLPYSELDEAAWKTTPRNLRRRVEEEYEVVFGGKSITDDKDKHVIIDGKRINVLQWAASRAKQLSGGTL